MTEKQLLELGFEKDTCFNKPNGNWKMPWGGADF